MDITRGSRRARNVAANTANGPPAAPRAPNHHQLAQAQAQAQAQAEPQPAMASERQQLRPQQPQQRRDMHRTPDQRLADSDEGHILAGAPRANPFRLHRTTRGTTTPRLSMPMESDGSDSEADLSVLAMARGGRMGITAPMPAPEQTQTDSLTFDDDTMSQGQYEPEETSMEEPVELEGEEEEVVEQEVVPLVDPSAIGLKEISNLGKFTVSSHKPGNGVNELRHDDLKLFWQSDGPQPHKLTIYFVKRVGIRVIRFFVDYQEDESYTPTKIVFKSGTSENNLIEFATMNLDSPFGWQDVPISGAGGDPDGNTLVSYVLQMQILENHQNGKDTHLRGIKIYAFDPDSGQGGRTGGIAQEVADLVANAGHPEGDDSETRDRLSEMARTLASARIDSGDAAFSVPDFMREPELR